MNSTLIESLFNNDMGEGYIEDDVNDDIKDDIKGDIQQSIFDFSLSKEQRLHALHTCYHSQPQHIEETIKKLNAIYCMSPIGLLRRFLYDVAMYSVLPIQLRVECAITLADIETSSKLGMDSLDSLIDIFDTTIPTPCKLEYIMRLVNNGYSNRVDTLYEFVNNSQIDEEYRYKTACNFGRSIENNGHKIMMQSLSTFRDDNANTLFFRILACQHILSQALSDDSTDDSIAAQTETLLLQWMTDESMEHRYRADASDVLMRFGSDENVRIAMNTLKILGGDTENIYENKENVHLDTFEEGVMDTIRYIDSLKIQPLPSFETVSFNIKRLGKQRYRSHKECIIHEVTQFRPQGHKETRHIPRDVSDTIYSTELTPEEEKINTALLRIGLDRVSYTDLNYTLQTLLLTLYAYIQTHMHKDQMEQRLLEELIDMSYTCSSGYVCRLVNVLSGFGHTFHITWEQQIVSNLAGRLNAKIKTDPNMERILEDMVNTDIGDRTAFLEFFRKNISPIKEEMYNEFKEHVNETDWDLWFRKAILNYET